MLIKKFAAPTMPEALARVKKELGEDAVILKTRMNRKDNGANEKGVEITAAIESDTKSRLAGVQVEQTEEAHQESSIAGADETMPEAKPSIEPDDTEQKIEELSYQVAELKELIESRSSQDKPVSFFGNISAELLQAGRHLMARNITEDLALKIISGIARDEESSKMTGEQIEQRMQGVIAALIPAGEPISIDANGKRVIMFVGPTGSGKTSMIARLAMNHKIENGGKTAIITTDNFRADSSHQIKSYCRIIDCPCGIVYSVEEMKMAIRSQEEGLILIDTTGITPGNSNDLADLAVLIKASNPDEIHLVVPAGMSALDLKKQFDHFAEIGVDRIVLTKLDETEAPGGVISAAVEAGYAFSYACSSREIPGQFGPVNPGTLAAKIVSRERKEAEKPEWEMEAVGIWQ